jgi:hypothetical protein
MAGEIDTAVAECIEARAEAAKPLKFNREALDWAHTMTHGNFTENLARVGGWETAGPNLLRAATLLGATAKAIALFHNPRATEINIHAAKTARAIVEKECRLGLASRTGRHPDTVGVADGLICGG